MSGPELSYVPCLKSSEGDGVCYCTRVILNGSSGCSEHSSGEWVEVRSKEEILATLDADGRLDGLPFMPQMLKYCGKRMQVVSRAHKTCDTVNRTGGRRMTEAVHLDGVRCDGAAYGGCQAACLIFWKDAWLKPVDESPSAHQVSFPSKPRPASNDGARRCTEAAVVANTKAKGTSQTDPVYTCQATQLPEATTLLKWWDLRQYWDDYRSGNVRLGQLLSGGVYVAYEFLTRKVDRTGLRLSPALIRLYDEWQSLTGGVPFPRKRGRIPAGQKTPSPPPLNLQPGEWVRVKSYEEILKMLDSNNKNRGLYFDAEEVPYCGKTFRVRSVVDRIIDERTGKMRVMKENHVILEGVVCKGVYSDRRMFCPREIYSFWREGWLERVDEAAIPKRPLVHLRVERGNG
jgi:hypothetical protein